MLSIFNKSLQKRLREIALVTIAICAVITEADISWVAIERAYFTTSRPVISRQAGR